MLSVSPEPQFDERSKSWLNSAFLDEPEVRSLSAFICALTSTRELHAALRLISEEIRALLLARFVAVVVFEDDDQQMVAEPADPTAIAVPLRVAGRSTGQITVYLEQPRALTATEMRAMEVIAAVAAVVLDNAKRLQRERKRLTQAEAVNNLAPYVATVKTHDELAGLVVTALKEKLHYDAARLLWRDGSAEGLVCLAATRGADGHTNEPAWRDNGAALNVLREGKSVSIGDQGDRPELPEGAASPGLRSLLAVPVHGSHKVLGVLEVAARSPRAFDNSDLVALTSLAAQVAAVGERLGVLPVGQGHPTSESDRARGELLSQVVHDLRGPLSVVKGYAATLLRMSETAANREKRRRFLASIDEAADRMSTIIDHVAGVSRLETGRVQFNLHHIDLAQLVTETVERLRPQLGEHPISLELPGAVLLVHADGEQIGRALGHLLLNAAHQSPADGRITVRVNSQSAAVKALSSSPAEARGLSRGQGYGVVEVRDEGPGIAREQLSRLFHRFQHLARPGERKKGSGLELYMARKIVEAHGGRVWAESELGQGSTFCFSLPLSVPDC